FRIFSAIHCIPQYLFIHLFFFNMGGVGRLSALLLIFIVSISGCICWSSEPSPPVPVSKVDELAASITPDPSTYPKVEDIVDQGDDALPGLYALLDDEDMYKRTAAAYALSRIVFESGEGQQGRIHSRLRKSFNDPEPSVSATAAGVSIALGDKSGIPYLIRHLATEETLLLIDPPETVNAYSIRVLKSFTGQDFGYDPNGSRASRAEAIGKWVKWWADNKDSLEWDLNKGEYGGYTER
ncbi:HEAT repeat domain-containing protein, partial [Candidatus Altiarchaeota archaeon]